MRTISFGCAAIFVLAQSVALAAPENPPVLLSINDANPSAVVITATGLSSEINFSGNTANDGIDLLDFFIQDEVNMSSAQFLVGSLEGGNSGIAYDDVWDDNYPNSIGTGPFLNLDLYVDNSESSSANTETFSTTAPAFTGTWTIDLASLGVDASALPSNGTEGSILSGDVDNPGQVIGDWEIQSVPEPTTLSLTALGTLIGGLTLRRRRTQANQK